jgi:two-component sensor histidine kinase
MNLEETAFFDMDIAIPLGCFIPLGIIVNELISNSIKHAFPGRDEGKIQIKLCRYENVECRNSREESKNEGCCKSTSFTLTVSDDGGKYT